jgi:hypothetical protein
LVRYKIIIKNCKKGQDDGIYELKIFDKEKEVYSGKSNVEISKKPIKLIDSNWKPETKIQEGENLDLTIKIDKPVENVNDVILYKDGSKLSSSDDVKLSLKKSKDKNGEPVTEINLKLNDLKTDDSAKYKLAILDSDQEKENESELASTNLFVEEIPIKVTAPLKSSKDKYEEKRKQLELRIRARAKEQFR